MTVITRIALPSDVDALAELYLRARRAGARAGTIPMPAHDDHDVHRWVAELLVPKLECWIATDAADTITGMLVLEADQIDQLYVEPVLTGHGIGTELMAVAKRLRPAGLRVWTFVSNHGAQRFYLRHGFREMNRTDGSANEERAPDIQYAWQPSQTAATRPR